MRMIAVAVIGITGECAARFHSIPFEGHAQGWLRVSVGIHRIWLSWHPSKPDNSGWVGQKNFWGFRYNRYTDGDGYVSMTAWYLIPFGLFAAAGFAWRVIRPAPNHPGYCPACGHDLRATPERCPECGCTINRPLDLFAD